MTARTTLDTTKTASQTQINTVIASEATCQESVNVPHDVSSNVATLIKGNSTFVAAVVSANNAKAATLLASEQAKQASLAVARDTLRATGDVGPV